MTAAKVFKSKLKISGWHWRVSINGKKTLIWITATCSSKSKILQNQSLKEASNAYGRSEIWFTMFCAAKF